MDFNKNFENKKEHLLDYGFVKFNDSFRKILRIGFEAIEWNRFNFYDQFKTKLKNIFI